MISSTTSPLGLGGEKQDQKKLPEADCGEMSNQGRKYRLAFKAVNGTTLRVVYLRALSKDSSVYLQ